MIRTRTDNLVLAMALLTILISLISSGDVAVMIPAMMGVIGGRVLTGKVGSGRSLPTGTITLAVLGVMGVVVAATLSKGFDIELFSRLLALLMALKTFERRSSRDLSQLMMLSVFLAIGALLLNSGLLVGLGLVLLAPLLVATTMSMQLLQASELARSHAVSLTGTKRRSFQRTVALLSVLGLGGSLVIFLVIPRGLAEQAFGSWGEVSLGNSTVGFDDEINLDIEGLISDSQTPVLDLQVLGPEGQQLGSSGKHYYLRGAVLDVYENRKWKSPQSSQAPVIDRYLPGNLNRVTINSSQTRRAWTIEQHVLIRNAEPNKTYVFGSWEPYQIVFEQPTNVDWRRDVGTAKFHRSRGKIGYTLRVRNPLAEGDLSRFAGRGRFPQSESEFTESVRAYAASLLEDAQISPDGQTRPIEDDRRAARVFENHLRLQFGYTLSPNAPEAKDDPIEWFLLVEQSGHCEYFASAMAAMCRSVGIQARVVTGYVATEFNELTGYYVVRESNAHAWVEVQVVPGEAASIPGADRGIWDTFDPTPPADLRSIHEPKSTLLAKAKHMFETAEFLWINTVIGFGADTQTAVVGTVQMPAWFQTLQNRADVRLQGGNSKLVVVSMAIGLSAFTGCLFLLTLLKLLWLRVREKSIFRWGFRIRLPRIGRSRVTRLEGLYFKILRSLDRAGVPKPRSTPLRRHLLESGDTLAAERRSAFLRAANLLYLERFGRGGISPEEYLELVQAVREATARPNRTNSSRGD